MNKLIIIGLTTVLLASCNPLTQKQTGMKKKGIRPTIPCQGLVIFKFLPVVG